MSIKKTTTALVCALLGACGTAHGVAERPGDLIWMAGNEGLRAVEADSGRVVRDVPEGLTAPDLSSIVATTYDAGVTTVTRTTLSGRELSSTTVEGDVVARIVSEDSVVLTDRAGAGETAYLPAPKERTRVVVLDDTGEQREYRLEGNFEPEAFKVDETELFMIEYIPAMAPERYRVRRLRLRSGNVRPIGRLKLNAPGQMQGTGRTQVMSPYGDELYTLYTQQLDAGHAGDHSEHPVTAHAFVHLLNLSGSWAHCIDLPPVFASGTATASAIAVSPSGARVFVADWTNGAVASLNPRKVRVADMARAIFGTEDAETSAAASADRLYVGGNDTVVVLDADTLEVIDRWTLGGEIEDVKLVDESLYVTTETAVVVLDPEDGREMARTLVIGGTGGTAIEGVIEN